MGLKAEVDEVLEEIPRHRKCYLEDELADVLWDYLNAVIGLEEQCGISLESIIARSRRKYEARVDALENGETWATVKRRQQQEPAAEHDQQELANPGPHKDAP